MELAYIRHKHEYMKNTIIKSKTEEVSYISNIIYVKYFMFREPKNG